MESKVRGAESRLQKNIEFWSEWDARHAIQLQYFEPEGYEFCKTEKGELNLRKGDLFYHDPKGAAAEAKRWFEGFDLSDFTILYVYGTGLGYGYLAAKEWLRGGKNRRIVFLEDDLAVLYYLFQTEAGSQMVRDKRVGITFFSSEHHMLEPFSKLSLRHLNISFTVQALPIYSKSTVFEELTHKLISEATIMDAVLHEYNQLGLVFYRNFYHILLNLPGCYSGDRMFGQFTGVPAIICGAGPSLGKHFDLLKTLGTRALILAGGSALNALNSANIMPHFGGGIDPNPAQYDRYIANTSYELPFFFRSRLYSRAFDIVHGPKLYLSGSGGYSVARYFDEILGIEGEVVDEGYNIINLLIGLVYKMGCNPIILVGMDLGFTGLNSYAPGVIDDPSVKAEELESVKDVGERGLLRKDIYGNPLYTQWKWIVEAGWIESFAKNHDDVKIINATEGGYGCGKVPNQPLQEAVDAYCTEQCDYFCRVHAEVEESPLDVNRKKIVDAMKRLKKSLKRCIKLLEVLVKETKRTKRMLKDDVEVMLNHLTGEAVFAEEELGNEDGFLAVLMDFNEMFNSILYKHASEMKHMRSEKKKAIKKMQIQEKKYRFLREVARANVMSIDHALKTNDVKGRK